MDPRPLRALSRALVRELGMLSQQCGELALTPLDERGFLLAMSQLRVAWGAPAPHANTL